MKKGDFVICKVERAEDNECCRCGKERELHRYWRWKGIYHETLCKLCIDEHDAIIMGR